MWPSELTTIRDHDHPFTFSSYPNILKANWKLMASTLEPARSRHRIQEIGLGPSSSKYDISAKLLLDGKEIHKLRSIKKGQPLRWADLVIPCDVDPDSELVVQVTEEHVFREDRVGLAKYRISRVANDNEVSIGCDNQMFTVKLNFFDDKAAEQPYTHALAKAKETQGQQSILNKAGKAGQAFKALIDFGGMVADLDPTGSSKVVVAVCGKAWEYLEQQEKQNVELNNLVESLAAIVSSIKSVEGLANADLGKTIAAMLRLIEDALVFIIGYRSRGMFVQTIYSSFDSSAREQVQEFVSRFQTLKEEFDRAVALQTLEAVHLEKLEKLNPVGHASYDGDRACMPGTRKAVIDDIVDWAQNDSDGKTIHWIHGFAGLGKSSIAASVCERLEEHGMLAASFFCKRDDPDLRDPRRVLNTIVYGLATRYKPYGQAVAKAIQDDAQLCSSHIQRRYTGFVQKPLQSLGKPGPGRTFVVVVDALDECEGRDGRAPLLACLRSMGQIVPWLKLIVTSRPHEDITTAFRRGDDQVISRNLFEDEASQDIYAFVQKQMMDIATAKRRTPWTEGTIRQLAGCASGLFIWAATACRFIAKGFNPEVRLQQILGDTRSSTQSHPLAALDKLYESAIRHSMSDDHEDNRQMVRRCLGVIVCTSKRTPLPVSGLEALLFEEVEAGALGSVVGALGSVLYEDGPVGGPVRLYHPSFEDYLVSRSEHFHVDLDELEILVARCCLNTMLRELRFNICNLETSHVLNRDVPDLEDRIRNGIGSHLEYSCLYWSTHLGQGHTELERMLNRFLFGRTLLYWIEALSLFGKLNVGLSSLLTVSGFTSESLADCSSCADDAYRFILAFYDPISQSTPHLYLSALAFPPANSGIARRMRPHFPNTATVTSGGSEQWSACLRTIPVSSEISRLEVTFDGSRIVSGHNDGTVQVWDVDTGAAALEPLQSHLGRVCALAISWDNRLVASSFEDMTVMVWNIETGAKTMTLGGHSDEGGTEDWILSIAFSPSGHRIASGTTYGKVMVWDTETGAPLLKTSVDTGAVLSVVFSHHRLYIPPTFGKLSGYFWSGETDDLVLRPIRGPQHWPKALTTVVSSQRRCLVMGNFNNKIHIWDYVAGTEACEPLDTKSDSVYPLTSSPDVRYLLTSQENIVQVWDTCTGARVGNPLFCHPALQAVAFSPRNHRIISSSSDRTIRIWSNEYHYTYHKPRESVPQISSVALSPNGNLIVSGHSTLLGTNDRIFRLWDALTGALILSQLLEYPTNVSSVAFSSDGRHIASGLDNGKVVVCDAESGAIVRTLEGSIGRILSVGFWADTSLVYSCSFTESYSLCAWDLRTGTVVRDATIWPSNYAMSTWGTSKNYPCTAFSQKGRLLASSFGAVDIKDLESNTSISTLVRGGYFLCLAFSPDSRCIVSGSWDKAVRLWDVETGTLVIEPLRGHSGAVLSVSFSHDGRLIVSGSDDCTIRIWDAATGVLLYKPLLGRSDPVQSVTFSCDGHHILSRGGLSFVGENSICVWDLDTLSQATEMLSPPSPIDAELRNSTPFLRAGAVAASRLARHTSSGGWVTTADNEYLLWLPVEYRLIDDSSLCISRDSTRIGVVIDMRRFVHGTSWTTVAGPAVDID
ncbi:hypothetical protein FS749_007481 [Ceratobasidium sp. UAMH 11750]|nr:hypothetical protein FS749_007481 [Ceratobasidium sp. UAMH 11750]